MTWNVTVPSLPVVTWDGKEMPGDVSNGMLVAGVSGGMELTAAGANTLLLLSKISTFWPASGFPHCSVINVTFSGGSSGLAR